MKQKDVELFPIFPQLVAKFRMSEPFTSDQMRVIVNAATDTEANYENKSSRDKRILECEAFKSVKEEILIAVSKYAFRILKHSPTYDLRITQSWLNFANKGESHHAHTHQNSVYSGVLYIQTGDNPEDSGRIHFSNTTSPGTFSFVVNEFNKYNANSWWVPVTAGDILIFPSYLAHYVEKSESEKTRISLAFNTFPNGVIGDERAANELVL